jgi:hypothetical protein
MEVKIMKIRFCLDDGGDELYSIESNDVAGVIEAAKGQKVIFQHDWYRYDNHILNHYINDDDEWNQEVIIYLVQY